MLDHLARSMGDLLNILDTIGKAGAGFKSRADAWPSTKTKAAQAQREAGCRRFTLRGRQGRGRLAPSAKGIGAYPLSDDSLSGAMPVAGLLVRMRGDIRESV